MSEAVAEASEKGVASLPKLNIGAGLSPKEGYVNLDMEGGPGIDVVHDMTVIPWPFPDGHFGGIEASHVLEHIPMEYVPVPGRGKRDALIAVMEEIYRVTAPGGRVYIQVPSVWGQGAYQDPTHRRFLVERSIYYFARPPWAVPGTSEYEGRVYKDYIRVKNISFSRVERMTLSEKEALQAEAKEWGLGEGKPPEWDWDFHKGNYSILCFFDCVRFDFDQVNGYLNWFLRKPEKDPK